MDKSVTEKINKNVCKLLEEYAEKGFRSPADIQTVKNLLSCEVKIKTSKAMDEFENESSGRRYYDNEGSFRRRHYYDDGGNGGSSSRGHYDDGGHYDNGSSGRRYYDSYSEGHSGHSMRQELEQLLHEAHNDNERRAIKSAIDSI